MDLHNKLAHATQSTAGLDGVDKILLAELADSGISPARIALVDFISPQIFDELAQLFPGVTFVAYNDSFVDARNLDAEADVAVWGDRYERLEAATGVRFPAPLFDGTDVILMRLPKSLDYLSEFVQAASLGLSGSAMVLLAERTKFMTPTQNDVLAQWFTTVSASLGRFKSRALRATGAVPQDDIPAALRAARAFPRSAYLADLDLTVVAHGGVFAGTKLDIGSRLFVDNLGALLDGAPTALDFVDAGCGTGVLSARVAQLRADAHVTAVDVSAAAVLSTTATALENGLADRITAVQDDALAALPTASADVVVCNPPFHMGTSLDTDVAQRIFENAGRVLRPGGQLWTVYNSPLPYKGSLNRLVGRTVVVASNRKFTVTVSTKR